MYIDVLNYRCGSISHAFGVLVSGCTHTHVNCNLRVYYTSIHVYVDISDDGCRNSYSYTEFNKRMSGVVIEGFLREGG